MVEHTDFDDATEAIRVVRPAVPGQLIAFAGSDLARGETVLRRGKLLTSREIGMLAAVGRAGVEVWRRPRVAVLSTGDEIVAPGAAVRPGAVYDSNAAAIAAAAQELGGEPVPFGIVPDDEAALELTLRHALEHTDLVILSGGTSKGAGDVSYRAVARLGEPGILVHGVALKPGKPLCLAVIGAKPVIVLPGFPTSAMFTFEEFAAPLIRAYGGRTAEPTETVEATLAARVPSELGRAEFVMVSLVSMPGGDAGDLAAYPTAKSSGAVTAFAQADGFFAIPQLSDGCPAGRAGHGSPARRGLESRGSRGDRQPLHGSRSSAGAARGGGHGRQGAQRRSMGGLAAARRGECDVAGIHLLDPESGVYNLPFLNPELDLIPGYRRMQGIVFRRGDARFEGVPSAAEAVAAALADEQCVMVNRNPGSGTRILIDGLLDGAQPAGYWAQPKSHGAVAAAVAQGRADWGVAISPVAELYDLGFLPLVVEHYDLVVPRARRDRAPVQRLIDLLMSEEGRDLLRRLGFEPGVSPGG